MPGLARRGPTSMNFPIRISTAYRACAPLKFFLAIAKLLPLLHHIASWTSVTNLLKQSLYIQDGGRIQVTVQERQRKARIIEQWRQEEQAEGADPVQPRCHIQASSRNSDGSHCICASGLSSNAFFTDIVTFSMILPLFSPMAERMQSSTQNQD